MSVNSLFDGPVTNLLSVLCISIEIVSRALVKGGGEGGVKCGTFIVRLLSDGAASVAVEGLS